MKDLASRITSIEEEIRKTPYHKATEHHLGQLKAKLAKLKDQENQQGRSQKTSKLGFIPKKAGDATIVLIGPPSVGKSTLLNCLTSAHSRVEPWPFSTVKVIPGVLAYRGAQIQLLDLPGVIGRAGETFGHSREIFSVARNADLLLIMVDLKTRSQARAIKKELQKIGLSIPVLTLINKSDLVTKSIKNSQDELMISAKTGQGIEKVKQAIWQQLQLMRIYLKPKDKPVDRKEPLILRGKVSVANVAARFFPDKADFKQILLWGPSAKFPSQTVSLQHKLKDEDVLSFS